MTVQTPLFYNNSKNFEIKFASNCNKCYQKLNKLKISFSLLDNYR